MAEVFTIGHSNHTLDALARLLDEHDVTVVLDVRSVPYSRRHPQFNRETLEKELSARGFGYEYLGHALGARGWGDEFISPEGKVDFYMVRKTPRYEEGIKRVLELAGPDMPDETGRERPALLCAEREPYDCHRFVLVSYSLARLGLDVRHILADGSIVTNSELEGRLMDKYVKPDLFDAPASMEEALALAYERRNSDF